VSVFRSRRRAALLAGGLFAGVVVPGGGSGGGGGAAPIATTPLTSLATGPIGWNFASAYQVGFYVDGRPFALTTAPGSLSSVTPASTSVTGPNAQPRQMHGMTVNAGALGTQAPGRPNDGTNSNALHGLDTGTGFVGQGVSVAGILSPPVFSQSEGILNVDPGYTGSAYNIPAGANLSLTKAQSNPDNSAAARATSRIFDTRVLHFVSVPPLEGAFSPAVAEIDKTPRIYWGDVDLSGLPSWTTPANAPLLADQEKQWPHWDLSTLSTEPMRYNWPSALAPTYGRNIANDYGALVLLLLSNVTQAIKENIARQVVSTAIQIVGRLEQGGVLTTQDVGGQMHHYPLIVAAAAWLTRNSARGDYFRQYLSGAKANVFTVHFGNPRPTQEADWRRQVTRAAREAPSGADGGTFGNYFWHQARPGQQGAVWASTKISQPGDGLIGSRIGQQDYMWNQYGSALAWALFLTKVGGRSIVPYPHYWTWMDMVAHMALVWWPLSNTASTTSVAGDFGREKFLRGTEVSNFAYSCLTDANFGWPMPSGAGIAAQSANFTPSFELIQATNASATNYRVEQCVAISTNRLLSRDPTFLPVKEAFTILRNGSPLAIDTTGAAGGDARLIGAIQIRGENILLFTDPAVLLQPGDVITVQTNFAGNAASRPRALDGTLLPDFGPITATLRATGAIPKPSPTQLISFGKHETAVGGTLNDGSDPTKGARVVPNPTYLSQKFGLNLTTERMRKVLIGWRGRTAPNGGSRSGNVVLLGRNFATDASCLCSRNSLAENLEVRLIGTVGSTISWNCPGLLPAALDGVDAQYWIEIDIGTSSTTSVVRWRVNDNAVQTLTQGSTMWPDVASVPRLAALFESMGLMSNRLRNAAFFGGAIREFYIAYESGVRGMPTYSLSDNARFGTGVDWGSRGQNVLFDRPDYAGRSDGGIPELYFVPTLAQAQGGSFANLGLQDLALAEVEPLIVDNEVIQRTWLQLA
jgi:hypothetical protein